MISDVVQDSAFDLWHSTNSIENGATLKQVMDGITDGDVIDQSFIPYTLGGTVHADGNLTYKGFPYTDAVKNISNRLSEINTRDPITNVFGVYDNDTFKPITDYNKVYYALRKGGGNINVGQNWTSDVMEITTASGKVYNLNGLGITENTKK